MVTEQVITNYIIINGRLKEESDFSSLTISQQKDVSSLNYRFRFELPLCKGFLKGGFIDGGSCNLHLFFPKTEMYFVMNVRRFLKQLTCKHEWVLHSYFDEYTSVSKNYRVKERIVIICKQCAKQKIRKREVFQGGNPY